MPLSACELFTSALYAQRCLSPMPNIPSLFYHVRLLGLLLVEEIEICICDFIFHSFTPSDVLFSLKYEILLMIIILLYY